MNQDNEQSNSLVVANISAIEKPLTPQAMRTQQHAIHQVLKTVMKQGVDYDKVFGSSNAQMLLKPGAEKITSMFQISVTPEVEFVEVDDGIKYTCVVKCHSRSGVYLGSGVGVCSSLEEKYKWRKAVNKNEFDDTPPDRRRVKYYKPQPGQRGPNEVNQVRQDPADLENTILKMAKKRALVDAVLTVTAASDIFEVPDGDPTTQDTNPAASAPPKPQPNKSTKPAAPAADPDAPLSNSQIRTIEKMMAQKNVTDSDLQAISLVPPDSGLDWRMAKMSNCNNIIKFLSGIGNETSND